MADEIPPGWYRDASGTIRWWDGQRWTEHIKDAATSVMPAVAAEPAVPAYMRKPSGEIAGHSGGNEADDASDNASRRVWLTSTFVGLLAFFLGMGLGGRGESATPTVPTPAVPTPVGTATADPLLDQREQELDRREQDLEDLEQELDDREQELNDRENAAPTPTAGTETIEDGTSEVGIDVPAGTYTTAGPKDTLLECKYTISSDEAGTDVIDDDASYDSMTVSLSDGEYFTSENCQTWQAG
jgi:hypothetical protein